MKAKFALIMVACVSVSGCATVDLANVGGTSSAQTASSNKAEKVNVVQLAASKLYAAFATEGWVANKNRKRVQSAASVLLRGLDSDSADGALTDYANSAASTRQIRSDILTAQQYVSQTTKAAEVYLAMAPDETNLREELASLQKALIASREAELVFKDVLDGANVSNDTLWKDYGLSVDALRDITDAFGDRVRSGRTMTSALQVEIN